MARQFEELASALRDEARRLGELAESLVRQREAIAANDTAAVEDTVAATGRTLLTLEEGRRRRAALVRQLAQGQTVAVGELESCLGVPLPAAVAAAQGAVREAAAGVQREAKINQLVLRRLLDAGDAFLQQLFSAGMEQAPAYSAAAAVPRAAVPSGRVLDRQA